MLASSISQGSGAGWPGVLCRGSTWLTAWLRMSSHLRFVIALEQFMLWFYSRPSPPSCFGKYVVSIWLCFHWLVSVTVPGGWLRLTGLSWIPYASGSVWFVVSPSFLGTIPQAYLLLMSLILTVFLVRLDFEFFFTWLSVFKTKDFLWCQDYQR